MATDTGESTAAINRRADVNAWPQVCVALMAGAVLVRPAKLTRYFTQCKDDHDINNGVGISASFVKELESTGTITRVGVDTYAIGDNWQQTHGTTDPAAQIELF